MPRLSADLRSVISTPEKKETYRNGETLYRNRLELIHLDQQRRSFFYPTADLTRCGRH